MPGSHRRSPLPSVVRPGSLCFFTFLSFCLSLLSRDSRELKVEGLLGFTFVDREDVKPTLLDVLDSTQRQ